MPPFCLSGSNQFLLKLMILVRNDALLGSFQPLQRRRSRTWEKESWQCHVPQREHTPGYSEHYGEKHEVNSIGCLRWRSMAAINPSGGILPICETPLWLCGVENISRDHIDNKSGLIELPLDTSSLGSQCTLSFKTLTFPVLAVKWRQTWSWGGGGHSYDTVQHMDDRKTLSTTAAVAFE